ncbi:unnamed protein product [Moneuplotes crassus]|uniref:Uncharacterized protein n=1 Tax=Euplotes crassus TaxID=5936 RepID=A0AAD2DA10_EUPCR|nr:unnamed protein product [Moneuplotes crassus]
MEPGGYNTESNFCDSNGSPRKEHFVLIPIDTQDSKESYKSASRGRDHKKVKETRLQEIKMTVSFKRLKSTNTALKRDKSKSPKKSVLVPLKEYNDSLCISNLENQDVNESCNHPYQVSLGESPKKKMLSTINLSHVFEGNIKNYQVTSAMKEHTNKSLKRPKTSKSSSLKRKWRHIPLALFPFGTKIVPKQPYTTPKNPDSVNLEIKNSMKRSCELAETQKNDKLKKGNSFIVKARQNSVNQSLNKKKSLSNSRKFVTRNTLFLTKKRRKMLRSSKRRSQSKNPRGKNLFPYNWPCEESVNTSSRPSKTAQGARPARMSRTTKTTPVVSPSKTSLHKKIEEDQHKEMNKDLVVNDHAEKKRCFKPNQSTGSPSVLLPEQEVDQIVVPKRHYKSFSTKEAKVSKNPNFRRITSKPSYKETKDACIKTFKDLKREHGFLEGNRRILGSGYQPPSQAIMCENEVENTVPIYQMDFSSSVGKGFSLFENPDLEYFKNRKSSLFRSHKLSLIESKREEDERKPTGSKLRKPSIAVDLKKFTHKEHRQLRVQGNPVHPISPANMHDQPKSSIQICLD